MGIVVDIGVDYVICFVCDYALWFKQFDCNKQINIEYCLIQLYVNMIQLRLVMFPDVSDE